MTAETAAGLGPWLQRHQGGDPDARAELLRHSQGLLAGLIRRRLGRDRPGGEEAGDVLQNVMIRLDRSLRALRPPTVEDFLRLARCHVRRELTDLARRRAGRSPAPAGTRPADSRDPEDPLQLMLWAEVHARIAALPSEDRQLFELLYYRELAQGEAAARLRVSLRTLKRRWHRARARLLLALGNEPPF